MHDILIQEIVNKKIEVKFINKDISLPRNIQEQINNYWLKLLKEGKTLTRGDTFTISAIEKGNNTLKLEVKLTDYAHYMATFHNIIERQHFCKIIYTAALVETLDKKIIIGEMAPNTSTPGRLQFPGGGIDKNDLEGNSINLTKNIEKEIKEELGIDINSKDHVNYFKQQFLKTGGIHDFYAIIYKVELNLDQSQFIKIYNNYAETLISKNIIPEFSSLLFVSKDPEAIDNLLRNDTRLKVDYLYSLPQIIKMDDKYRNKF